MGGVCLAGQARDVDGEHLLIHGRAVVEVDSLEAKSARFMKKSGFAFQHSRPSVLNTELFASISREPLSNQQLRDVDGRETIRGETEQTLSLRALGDIANGPTAFPLAVLRAK